MKGLFFILACVFSVASKGESHVVSVQTSPQEVIVDGVSYSYSTHVLVGELKNGPQDPETIRMIQAAAGITAEGKETIPVEKLIVGPTKSWAANLRSEFRDHLRSISNENNARILRFSELQSPGWFEKHNTAVFSVMRFFMNGTAIGATLILSSHISLSKALIVGVLAGTTSAIFQYNVKTVKDWVMEGSLSRHFGAKPFRYNRSRVGDEAANFYNGTLNFVEELGKYGVMELSYLSLANAAMAAFHVGNIPVGFINNAKHVLTVATQLDLAQGVAHAGLFTDLRTQRLYSGWSDNFREIFRNASTFTLSALGVAAGAFRLANPGVGRVVSLWIIDMPYGFVGIAAIGVGFFIHSLFTQWSASSS